MTQLEFISGMKRLSSYYFKELTNDQLEAWYEMFKEVRVEDFNKAIKLISKENKHSLIRVLEAMHSSPYALKSEFIQFENCISF